MKLVQIEARRIRPSPYNPRHEAAGLDDLAASIKAVGIIEPLVVAISTNDSSVVELVAGNRRFAAGQLAGLKVFPCLVLPSVGERAQRTISLVENLHRREMSHIEQGEAFRDLAATGLSQQEVARQTGVSIYTVNQKINLVAKLIPEFQEMVHRDRMTLTEGLQMIKLPLATQREIFHGGRGGVGRLSHTASKRRTKTEAALMGALQSYRDGDPDMALAEARRAVGYLQNVERQEAS